MILSDALILPVSQLQTHKVMTSQIRSHRIFNTDLLYSCARFVVEIDKKNLMKGFFCCHFDLLILASALTVPALTTTRYYDSQQNQLKKLFARLLQESFGGA